MVAKSALLVADGADAQPELVAALRAGGFTVVPVTADDLAATPALAGRPDVVLLSASLGLQRVSRLSRRLSESGARPSILVFPENDLAALEACAQAGFDYVGPPFSAGLVRSRMISSWERAQLVAASEGRAVTTSLLEYERDLSIAHGIQADFLPESLPEPRGWRFSARFRAARLVAGDFYDGFELVNGRQLGFVVADVCDKGIGAALFMALIRTLLRHTAEHTGTGNLFEEDAEAASGRAAVLAPPLSIGAGPLLQAVVGTNRYLARNHMRQGYFATLFFGVLDPVSGGLLYINGGHNPPVVVRADGRQTLLQPTGPAVGMLPDSDYELGHTFLAPGDSLLVYTDGVIEARDGAGQQFGLDRLLAGATPAGSADELLDRVEGALQAHVGQAEQSDDITLLGLHRLAR